MDGFVESEQLIKRCILLLDLDHGDFLAFLSIVVLFFVVIIYVVRVEVDAQLRDLLGKAFRFEIHAAHRGSCEPHDNRKAILKLDLLFSLFLYLLFLFLLEVELSHDATKRVVALTVMALIEHNQHIVLEFSVTSSQAV